MSLTAVDRAIRARLMGGPLDSQRRSISGTGIRIPVVKKGNNTDATEGSWTPEFTGTYKQIPVYRYKEKGQPWDKTVPCVVYRQIQTTPNLEQTIFRRHIKVGTVGPVINLLDRAGRVTQTGKKYNVMRKTPASYDYLYQFDIYAESDFDKKLILEAFLQVFPLRTYLDYTQLDGSVLTVDMVQEDLQDEVLAPEGEIQDREAVQATLTYRVEAFEDTTRMDTQVAATVEYETTAEKLDGTGQRVRKVIFANDIPDLVTGLWAQYAMNDPLDSEIRDSGPNALHLAVTMDGIYPQRSTADGKAARLFSRANTTGTGSNPSNFATRALTQQQYINAVGVHNGNNGEYSVAWWFRRVPTSGLEGTGLDYFCTLTGDAAAAAGVQERASGMAVSQSRAGASNSKYRDFFIASPTGIGTSFLPDFAPLTTIDNVWTHVAFVCKSVIPSGSYTYEFYVNGVLNQISAPISASYAQQGLYPVASRINVSKFGSPNDGTQIGQIGGYLRDLRIYSKALRKFDIAALAAQ